MMRFDLVPLLLRRSVFPLFCLFLCSSFLFISGCARETKRTKGSDSSLTHQSSLNTLYGKIPNTNTAKKEQNTIPGIITPQSDLSLAVTTRQLPRLEKEFQRSSFTLGAPIFIRIFKESHELELWVQRGERFYLFKKYRIAYFSGGLGPKMREGDMQAPEGFYQVTPVRMNPRSNFHLAFNIGYPNEYDVIHHASGGMIMVHGKQKSIGCFAMTDPIIEEIYVIADQTLRAGEGSFQVHIFPFRMTPANLQRYANSPYIGFWKNMLHGYTLFELTHQPPVVTVKNDRYAFAGKHSSKQNFAQKNGVSIQRQMQVVP